MGELKYREITERIIGCAMRVHAALGNGFQEVIYQRALEVEFRHAGLRFEREFNMKIYYRGEEIGERRVDFFVENIVMVELKAIIKLENVHLAQGKNYLEAYNLEVGLLINFGTTSLEFKRLENTKHKPIPFPHNPSNPPKSWFRQYASPSRNQAASTKTPFSCSRSVVSTCGM